jgi:hypothetical protein
VTLRIDAASAAIWAAVTAAAGAAAGAFLEGRRGGASTAALRGGLAAYGWALFLLAAGVVIVATLEPDVTRSYLDTLRSLGGGGGGALLFGTHVLGLPSQSALLMAPASGTCLDVLGRSGAIHLCPWSLTPSGPVWFFLTERISLDPWFWSFSAVPAICAFLAGRRAVSESTDGRGIALGALAGVTFAAVAVAGVWYASPQVPFFLIPEVRIQSDLPVMAAALAAWGVGGGAVGGWLGRRG